MVQTGAKIQLGGLKLGLFNVKNQSFTELWVAKLDKKPMTKQTLTDITIFTSFFFKGLVIIFLK
ncbi:hypothetical protein FB2170_08209 [Maribacter sp. HTCC2170]|nr:hypothetical protein FB2170_08209 [Maribacter sp. HTCC2170]